MNIFLLLKYKIDFLKQLLKNKKNAQAKINKIK